MFNLLRRRPSPDRQDQRGHSPGHVLAEEDISRILQVFKISELSDDQDLILSNNALIKPAACIAAVKAEWETSSGRLDLGRLALQFGLETEALRKLLEREGNQFVFSQNYDSILSRAEESGIITALEQDGSQRYLATSDVCGQYKLAASSLQTLIGKSETKDLVIVPLGKGYIASQGLRTETEEGIRQLLRESEEGKWLPKWPPTVQRGLSSDLFLLLVKTMVEDIGVAPADHVEMDPLDVVTYRPLSWMIDRRKDIASHINNGSSACFEIHGHHTTTSKETLEYIDLQRAIVLDRWVVSLAYIDNELERLADTHKSRGYFDLRDIVKDHPIPQPHREELNRIVKSRVSQELRVLGDYAMQLAWVRELLNIAEGAGSSLADEVWKLDEPRPKGSALNSRLRDHMSQKVDGQMVDELWGGGPGLGIDAVGSFDRRMDDLELDRDEQFVALWQARVVDKIRLHEQALSHLGDEALRAQLDELLQAYIRSDLIPSTITRAKAKGLLRRSRWIALAAKVQADAEKGPKEPLSELDKFNTRLGILDYSKEELIDRRDAYLKDMVALMMKDGDAARLFIRLLIVLLAKDSEGALYATGKFAPKLLKLVKPKVDDADGVWLEQMKNSIKAGTVSDEMREAMRERAAKSIDSSAT